MGWNIESSFPLWLLPIAALLAIAAGWWAYYRRGDDGILPAGLKPPMMFLRAASIFLVALLIISPWIKRQSKVVEKPVFLIARDNSRSMLPASGTTMLNEAIDRQLTGLEEALAGRFEIQHLLFGESVRGGERPDYSDQRTDFEDLFNSLTRLYANRLTAGLLVVSDGAYNRGLEPSLAATRFPFPVHVLATGDTLQYPDLAIGEVIANEWVRRKSIFPVRVYFKMTGWGEQPFKIRLAAGGKILEEKLIGDEHRRMSYTDFMVEAPEKGNLNLSINIYSEQPERNLDNNGKTIRIRVIDKEGKVLILADAPHPDLAAFQRALGGVAPLQAEALLAEEFKGNFTDYSLLVLHGLPSSKGAVPGLEELIRERTMPVLFILSRSTNPDLFNRLETGCLIVNPRPVPEEAQGSLNRAFNLFTLPDDFMAHLAAWPPLELPYQSFALDATSQVLMFQVIRRIELMDPLLMIASAGSMKYGIIAGTGIWRWRLFEYLEQGNHDYFDDLLTRTVQFLMSDERQERFRIFLPDELPEFRTIQVTGYLRNRSMEAVNEPDVNLRIRDSAGNEFSYQMGRSGDHYQLDLNGFRAGEYRITAQTDFDGQRFEYSGVMVVSAFLPEVAGAVADHLALRRLAHSKNGSFFPDGDPEKLINFAKDLSSGEPAIHLETKWFDPISLGWLLLILVLFLSLEWFLRRWFGTR